MKNSLIKELKKGTKVELAEHKKVTKGKKSVARQIAKDHVLGENMPKYYEKLATLEKIAKKPKKKLESKRLKKITPR
jgi:hypothetical protein